MRKPTRAQAIKIIGLATDRGGYDDWWMDMMDDVGLYNESDDTAPSLFDVLEAIGVSKDEAEQAFNPHNNTLKENK